MVSALDFKQPWTLDKYAGIEIAAFGPMVALKMDGKTVIAKNVIYSQEGVSHVFGRYESVFIDGREVPGKNRTTTLMEPFACFLKPGDRLECASVKWKDLYPSKKDVKNIKNDIDRREKLLVDKNSDFLFPELDTKHAKELGAYFKSSFDDVKRSSIKMSKLPNNYMVDEARDVHWDTILNRDKWTSLPVNRFEFIEKLKMNVDDTRFDEFIIPRSIKFSKVLLEIEKPAVAKQLMKQKTSEMLEKFGRGKDIQPRGVVIPMLKEVLKHQFLPSSSLELEDFANLSYFNFILKVKEPLAGRLPSIHGLASDLKEVFTWISMHSYSGTDIERILKKNQDLVPILEENPMPAYDDQDFLSREIFVSNLIKT